MEGTEKEDQVYRGLGMELQPRGPVFAMMINAEHGKGNRLCKVLVPAYSPCTCVLSG